MRIAIYHNLPSGGAKRTLQEAARRLVSRHHVDVFALSCSEHAFADLRGLVNGHSVFPFEPRPLLKSPFGRLNQVLRCADLKRLQRVTRTIARAIDEGGYDIALVHPCRFEQSPTVLSGLERTPSAYYCHEPLRLLYEAMPERPYDDHASGYRRYLDRVDPLPAAYRRLLGSTDLANVRKAGTVLVNSRFTAGSVEAAYGIRAKVSYHGVDVERFKPAPVEKRHFVLSVGSLTPLKGFDFLIRAMARYPDVRRPELVIASNFENPPERTYLEQLARDLGVAVTFSGRIGDEELLRLYHQARAVVYAPIREPFGLVPLEAMACGIPVVAVAEGGIPESVVDGQTGLLTDRDPSRFADTLRNVIEDQTLAARLGANGRAHVLKEWSWERAVESLEGHLAAGLEARGDATRVPLLAR